MKKAEKSYIFAWLIAAGVFNAIVFLTPDTYAGYYKYGGSFWSGYIGIMIALICNLFCAIQAFKAENLTKLFYNIPLIRISYIGLILTFIAGIASMVIPDLPNWVGMVACAVILAFTILALIKAEAAASLVASSDMQIKEETAFIRNLTVQAESLLNSSKEDNAKSIVKQVYESIRFSDPRSTSDVKYLEVKISDEFNNLKSAVQKNGSDIDACAGNILQLLAERNSVLEKSK